MTVVAACTDGTTVWMAADTATNVQGRPVPNAARKIRTLFVSGGQTASPLFAVAGDGALARFDQQEIDAPGRDLDDWAGDVASLLTDWAMERGLSEDGHLDGTGLLGFDGRLWVLAHHSAIPVEAYQAIGSGGDAAVGAMHAALACGVKPGPELVHIAVKAALDLDYYCAAPITEAAA